MKAIVERAITAQRKDVETRFPETVEDAEDEGGESLEKKRKDDIVTSCVVLCTDPRFAPDNFFDSSRNFYPVIDVFVCQVFPC